MTSTPGGSGGPPGATGRGEEARAVSPDVWYRGDLEAPWAADAVALDVDGVLIDVTGSFQEAVRLTVARATSELGLAGPAWVPSVRDIGTLKAAGGFNDDIDVSIALTAIALGGRRTEVASIAAAVDAAGGGLAGLRLAAAELPRVPGRRILDIFETLYWGTPPAAGTAGTAEGAAGPGPALIDAERVLTDSSLPQRLRRSGVRAVAVVSGRTPRELEAALGKLGWALADLDAVVTGDLLRKPDPACLDRVVSATGCTRLVVVGDVRDDWELVRRYRAERPGGAATRGVMVGAADELAPLRALGCDATVGRVDEVVGLIAAWAGAGPDRPPVGAAG